MRLLPTSLRGRLLLFGGIGLVTVVVLIVADPTHSLSHRLALVLVVLILIGGLWTLDRTLRSGLRGLQEGAAEAEASRGVRVSEAGPAEFSALARTLNRTLEARDRAEEELLRTVERHDLVLRATRDMIWDWDLRTGRIHRNEALRTFSDGREVDASDLELWFGRIPEPDRTRVRRSLEEALEQGDSIWTQEYPFNRGDGRRARILDRGYVVQGDGGNPIRVVGVMSDVTEERRRSDEVRRARDRYESILRHAPFGVFLAAADGVILEWNPALERILGESWAGQVPRRKAHQFFVDPRDFETLAAQARNEGTIIGCETRWRKSDGEEIHVRLTASAFLERGRIALEVLAEDVTERRRLGEQVRQAQKMEAIGRLAGGVAHDFNNLLTVISGEARFLLSGEMSAGIDEEVRESLEAIQEAGDRGGGLTRQLLAFSRRQVVQKAPLDLNEVVRKLERMLVRVLGEQVELTTDLAREVRPVVADAGEMEQVLVNLAVNARDAMPDGGTLEIQSTNIRVPEGGRGPYPGVEPGDHVVLTVRDEGMGIDPRTRGRIFEPFFTTKPVGKGTGLGLSTVYGIVTRGGGIVDVESQPGEGTIFRIVMPAATGEVPRPRTPPEAGVTGATVDARIVIVEDEDRVRRMAERILDRAGYRIEGYGHPEEAIEALGRPDLEIDLLITDVRMPGLDGEEMADRIRLIHPDLPILFISGYPEEMAVQERSNAPLSDFLAKPFTPESLLARVQLLLSRTV